MQLLKIGDGVGEDVAVCVGEAHRVAHMEQLQIPEEAAVVVRQDDKIVEIDRACIAARRGGQCFIAPRPGNRQAQLQRRDLQQADVVDPVDAEDRHIPLRIELIVRDRLRRRFGRAGLRLRFGVRLRRGDLRLEQIERLRRRLPCAGLAVKIADGQAQRGQQA